MFGDLLQDLFIGGMPLVVLFIELMELVDDLSFLESSVTDGCQDSVPLSESVFFQDHFLVFRFKKIRENISLGFAVGSHKLPASADVLFLHLPSEPLVDLVARRSASGDAQPVRTGAFGVLGCYDLDPVSVSDPVIYIDDLAVYTGSDHPVAHCRVNSIRKVDGSRASGEVLDLSSGRKAVNTVGKQIQVALEQIHEFLVVGHVPLPLKDLPEPGQFLLFLVLDLLAV